jgi:rhodanese-related sulfurtransferase
MNKGFAIIAPILIVLAIGLVLIPKQKDNKELTPFELLSEVHDNTRFVSTDKIAELIIGADPSLLLVDVRTAKDYTYFSLDGAINIPFDSLITEGSIATVSDPNKRVVLFSNSDIVAEQAYMIYKRLGVKNLLIMQGGLNRWFQTIIKPSAPHQNESQAEFDLYTFRLAAKQFFTGASTPVTGPANKPNAKKPIKVKTQPVAKQAAEGGC